MVRLFLLSVAGSQFTTEWLVPLCVIQPEELSQAGETPTIVDEAKLTMSVTDGNLVMSVKNMGVLGTIIPVPIHAGKVGPPATRYYFEQFACLGGSSLSRWSRRAQGKQLRVSVKATRITHGYCLLRPV